MTSDPPTGHHAPAGFDQTRDVAADIPLSLIERWRRTTQTSEDARRLLSAHSVLGYSLVSDSAGG